MSIVLEGLSADVLGGMQALAVKVLEARYVEDLTVRIRASSEFYNGVRLHKEDKLCCLSIPCCLDKHTIKALISVTSLVHMDVHLL